MDFSVDLGFSKTQINDANVPTTYLVVSEELACYIVANTYSLPRCIVEGKGCLFWQSTRSLNQRRVYCSTRYIGVGIGTNSICLNGKSCANR